MDDLNSPMITSRDSACSSSTSEDISQSEYSSTLNFNNLMAPTPSSCSSPDSLCDSQFSVTDYSSFQTSLYQPAGFTKEQAVPAVKDVYGQFTNCGLEDVSHFASRRIQGGRSRTSMHEMAVRKQLISEQLSEEEKRTLLHEGYAVPVFLPLNKSEEEALKVVRRKIKNKLSAQESRRRRKVYVDKLEQLHDKTLSELNSYRIRVQQLLAENQNLKEQIKHCQLHHHPTGVY
uniref:BZIP domain-containing protein n=1 Tax=Steinernema glaseri TaxID=37863 RepID=A0A1I7Z8Q8_9BILA